MTAAWFKRTVPEIRVQIAFARSHFCLCEEFRSAFAIEVQTGVTCVGNFKTCRITGLHGFVRVLFSVQFGENSGANVETLMGTFIRGFSL